MMFGMAVFLFLSVLMAGMVVVVYFLLTVVETLWKRARARKRDEEPK